MSSSCHQISKEDVPPSPALPSTPFLPHCRMQHAEQRGTATTFLHWHFQRGKNPNLVLFVTTTSSKKTLKDCSLTCVTQDDSQDRDKHGDATTEGKTHVSGKSVQRLKCRHGWRRLTSAQYGSCDAWLRTKRQHDITCGHRFNMLPCGNNDVNYCL